MFEWLWKRVFSEKNIGYLVQKAEPYMDSFIEDRLKLAIVNVLSDEEIGAMVRDYGDALYQRYMQKLGGFLGGKQKGLNFAIDKVNPMSQILDEDGNISLSNIFRTFLSGRMGQILPNASQGQSQMASMDASEARKRAGIL